MSEYTLTHDAQERPAHGLGNIAQMGDIRILTGGSRGPLRRVLHAQGHTQADRFLKDLIALFGRERILLESVLMPGQDDLGRELAELAQANCLTLVASAAPVMAYPHRNIEQIFCVH